MSVIDVSKLEYRKKCWHGFNQHQGAYFCREKNR